MTFDPHPDRVLWPERERLLLTTLDERLALIASLGIEHTIVLPFDRTLAQVPAEAFMRQVCSVMDLRKLWIGPDFRLGAGGRGTAPVLRELGHELGYSVHQVERVYIGEQPVSSTAIRHMLGEGKVDDAAQLLGHLFELHGVVVHGDHRGRTIGIPTANISPSAEQFIPADGVYACRVFLPGEEHSRPAVTNVGVRPTFDTKRRTVEAHILDWNGDIYDATISVQFVRRLRGEQRFSGIEALLAQIHADIAAAREIL
jgi:riboflavin kinase/FMN adenylyltransferase